MATWEYEKTACYVKQALAADYQPVFRAFDGTDHFYTTDENEYQSLPASYQREGVKFYVASRALVEHVPLYKLYHPESVDHFLTSSREERDTKLSNGWEDKGILGYSVESPSAEYTSLFQAYHPDLTDHLYTTSEAELEALGSPIPGSATTMVVKTGFNPKENGYLFRNRFVLKPELFGLDIGAWKLGFCGGMSLSAVRIYNSGEQLSRRKTIPRQGEGLYNRLFREQIETIPPHIIAKVHVWQSSQDMNVTGFSKGIGGRTKQEWPKIRSELDAGRPVVLVLIRVRGFFGNITHNHQVVAYGYKSYQNTQVYNIQIYDPNWPKEAGGILFSEGIRKDRINAHQRPRRSGQIVRGFFLNHKG